MSSVCRRRRSNQSGGSDAYDSSEELNNTKETQNSEPTDGLQNSDDESYSNESDDSQEGGPRESGDGQEEEKPQKKLDFDEDRRYPQYIPKRGTFYEHDDRTIEETTDEAAPTPNEREVKEKKVWKDKDDKWDHDRFNEHEQAPKSHEELIAVYGYDIRNEEGPPRARRRRRYGRGPNKYTRNWEDENAYGKPGGTPGKSNVRKFNRSGEDFPALKTKEPNEHATVEERVMSSAWYNSKNKSPSKTQNFPPLQREDGKKLKHNVISNTHDHDDTSLESTNSAWKEESPVSNSNGNLGPGGDVDQTNHTKLFSKDSTKKNLQESISSTTTKSRGRGMRMNTNNNLGINRMMDIKPKGRGQGKTMILEHKKNIMHSENEGQLIQEMKQINLNDSSQHQSGKHSNRNYYMQSPNQQQRTNLLPSRMQPQSLPQSHQPPHPPQLPPQQASPQQSMQQPDASGNRPKRYSSLRQRPTVSENPPQQNYQPQHTQVTQHVQHPQHTQHGYFSPQAYPPGHFEQSTPVAPAATPMGGQPVMSMPPNGQTASYAPPPFLVPTPQFVPAPTTSIINYVAASNGPPFPSNFQGYQGYNPSVQPQGPPPQELFQPQGCTYYSAAQQQHQQPQPAPVRRPKVAIPILPPPDNLQNQSRGRGRSNQQMNGQLVGNFRQPQNQHFALNEFEHPITVIEDHQTVQGQFDDLVNNQQMMDHCQVNEMTAPVIEMKNESTNVIEIIDNTVDLIEMEPQVIDETIPETSSDTVTDDQNDPPIEELNKVEINQVPEDPIIEEAAA